MGLSLLTYSILAVTGLGMAHTRKAQLPHAAWRTTHITLGLSLTILVLGLSSIGIVGTLGQYGSLGHSNHGIFGGIVVSITLLSAGAALQIQRGYAWARPLHIALNVLLGAAFLGVLWTGWIVVQQYLP